MSPPTRAPRRTLRAIVAAALAVTAVTAAAATLASLSPARPFMRFTGPAMVGAVGRKTLACLLQTGPLAGRARDAGSCGKVAHYEVACERGTPLACGMASAMLREGGPDDMPRAAALAEAATRGEPLDVCSNGDGDACRALLAESRPDGPWVVAALLQRACEEGDMKSCVDAVRARSAASRAGGQARSQARD